MGRSLPLVGEGDTDVVAADAGGSASACTPRVGCVARGGSPDERMRSAARERHICVTSRNLTTRKISLKEPISK